ncbi:flagellar hook assembly protein FlgD [Dyella jejuensis]|uniref:Basal-body rod modification protein FlgD n=1 Tax=Dyella jejuensis TaxID=1432009 RepID=A0ABW8JJ41_9GAMM
MDITNSLYSAADTAIDTNTPSSNDGKSISDMFTTLLVAQIQNQDPLAPMEASQFVTQFAQLSQVEAMQQMASLTAAAAAMQESMLVVTLGSQVGSQVMVAADTVQLDGETVNGGFVLEDHASEVTLVLTGPDGTEHRIELGAQEAGEVGFAIDPEELGLPPGKYAMRVDTNTGEKVRTEIQGELQGVRLGADGRVILSVAGIGDISTADITRFLGRPNSANLFTFKEQT